MLTLITGGDSGDCRRTDELRHGKCQGGRHHLLCIPGLEYGHEVSLVEDDEPSRLSADVAETLFAPSVVATPRLASAFSDASAPRFSPAAAVRRRGLGGCCGLVAAAVTAAVGVVRKKCFRVRVGGSCVSVGVTGVVVQTTSERFRGLVWISIWPKVVPVSSMLQYWQARRWLLLDGAGRRKAEKEWDLEYLPLPYHRHYCRRILNIWLY